MNEISFGKNQESTVVQYERILYKKKIRITKDPRSLPVAYCKDPLDPLGFGMMMYETYGGVV